LWEKISMGVPTGEVSGGRGLWAMERKLGVYRNLSGEDNLSAKDQKEKRGRVGREGGRSQKDVSKLEGGKRRTLRAGARKKTESGGDLPKKTGASQRKGGGLQFGETKKRGKRNDSAEGSKG